MIKALSPATLDLQKSAKKPHQFKHLIFFFFFGMRESHELNKKNLIFRKQIPNANIIAAMWRGEKK
jgi:hypothetical protein